MNTWHSARRLAASRRRQAIAVGFEDEPALSLQSLDGSVPAGRELSFGWLAGTVLTGLTSVLLMGATLYVGFSGTDNFSTAYRALDLAKSETIEPSVAEGKGDRLRPVVATKSERDVVTASVLETGDAQDFIRSTGFIRVRATMATSATNLSGDAPPYDPQDYIDALGSDTSLPISTDVLGDGDSGEVAVSTTPLIAVIARELAAGRQRGTCHQQHDKAKWKVEQRVHAVTDPKVL